jgi:hypothetical protein
MRGATGRGSVVNARIATNRAVPLRHLGAAGTAQRTTMWAAGNLPGLHRATLKADPVRSQSRDLLPMHGGLLPLRGGTSLGSEAAHPARVAAHGWTRPQNRGPDRHVADAPRSQLSAGVITVSGNAAAGLGFVVVGIAIVVDVVIAAAVD